MSLITAQNLLKMYLAKVKGEDIIIRLDDEGNLYVRQLLSATRDDIHGEMVYYTTKNRKTDLIEKALKEETFNVDW